jgi:hypothetical protein
MVMSFVSFSVASYSPIEVDKVLPFIILKAVLQTWTYILVAANPRFLPFNQAMA